jgi:uncharacterized pyridoxamine 5'-phosphate oxidase family protein
MDIDEILKFLQEVDTFYFCTCDDKPHCRPFGAVCKYENKLYFTTANTKEVYKQIIANNNVQIVACKSNREWLRISAKAVIDDREIAKTFVLNACPILRTRYKTVNDNGFTVLYLEHIEAETYK